MIGKLIRKLVDIKSDYEIQSEFSRIKLEMIRDGYRLFKNFASLYIQKEFGNPTLAPSTSGPPNYHHSPCSVDDLHNFKGDFDNEVAPLGGPKVSSPKHEHFSREQIMSLITETIESSYVVPSSRRDENADQISYESSTTFIKPGHNCTVMLGTSITVPGSEWPGLFETGWKMFGTKEDFKPLRVTLSSGFALVGGFSGSRNWMQNAPGTVEISSEVLASDNSQPDFPPCPRGISISITVKNTSSKPLPCTVRVVGRRAETNDGLNTFPNAARAYPDYSSEPCEIKEED